MEKLDPKEYLKKYSRTQVDFYRFNGNYGDSLIWHGTMKLLEYLNIEVNYVNLNSVVKNDVLLIDGGGNFVDYYSEVRDFLKQKHDKYEKVVILPHTINGEKQKDILSQLGNNCTIFCREEKSYEFVKKYFTGGELYLWHDCAFYNDFSSYLSHISRGKGVLNVFRLDCESAQKEVPEQNIDISSDGWCKKPLDSLLEIIINHNEIRTDRLHVAIATALLGKKVLLFSNSYYKNLAVYNHSLKKYPNVIFIYKFDEELITQKNISHALSSYKRNELSHFNILDLFYQISNINYNIWKLEDIVRDAQSGYETIVNTKRSIDKANQYRNDTISKIDINLSVLLNNAEKDMMYFVSESPGSLIDRLSIFYIRKTEIEKILAIIHDNDDLLEIYGEKLLIVNGQIKYLESYLKQFIENIKKNKVYFRIFEPIKIYNDPNIKNYISQLRDD